MSCSKPTYGSTHKTDPSTLIKKILALSNYAPGLNGSALACLDFDPVSLDQATLDKCREALDLEMDHYPQRAGEAVSILLSGLPDNAAATADALLKRFDFLRLSQAFELCHAKLEMVEPGLGRKLAGKIAMRAVRYPIVNYWVFGIEPLATILRIEPLDGFTVELGGGQIPWLVAWALAALEDESPPSSIGVGAVFDMLLDAGCCIGSDGAGQALDLACAAMEQANPRARAVAELLMGAGAPWEHVWAPKGSITEKFLLTWPQVRRAKLKEMCGQKNDEQWLPAM